jgi:hypothetical protein
VSLRLSRFIDEVGGLLAALVARRRRVAEGFEETGESASLADGEFRVGRGFGSGEEVGEEGLEQGQDEVEAALKAGTVVLEKSREDLGDVQV